MKVAVVVETFPKLSESFILNQIISLIERKIEVDIYAERTSINEPVNENVMRYKLYDRTTFEPVQGKNKIKRIGGHILLALLLLFRRPFLFFKLIQFQGKPFNKTYLYAAWPFLRQKKYDIVHAHFGPIGVKVCNLQKLGLLRSPLVCSFHGYDVDRNSFRSNPSFYTHLFDTARYITGNSKYTVNNIFQLGCPKQKLVILPESLITRFFKPDSINNHNAEFVTIITVARLVEFKGIEYALKAVAELLDRGIQNFKYSIIGDGPLKEALKKQSIDSGTEGHVEFFGARPQEFVLEAMKKADIFLLSGIIASDGRQENQGLVLQEAQAMELPVVASDTGGISEGLINGSTGFLVEPKNYKAFADKLQLLIQDRDLRIRLGRNGREFVCKKFDSVILGERLIDLYSSLLPA